MFGIILAIVIIFLILVAVFIYRRYCARYNAYLAGMWVGESTFLEQAGLSQFYMFFKNNKEGYIVMIDEDGETVANHAIDFTVKFNNVISASLAPKNDACTAVMKIKATDGEECPIADVSRLTMSMLDGTLALYDSKKLFAFLQKDISASALALSI